MQLCHTISIINNSDCSNEETQESSPESHCNDSHTRLDYIFQNVINSWVLIFFSISDKKDDWILLPYKNLEYRMELHKLVCRFNIPNYKSQFV